MVCIDIDRSKLQMLANNASIYGVHPSKLLLLLGDARKIMKDCYKNGKLTFRSDNDLQADSEVANEELPSSTQICQLTTNSDEKGKPTENDALYPIRGMESLPLSIKILVACCFSISVPNFVIVGSFKNASMNEDKYKEFLRSEEH